MNHAMCALPSPKAAQASLQKEKASDDASCARGGGEWGAVSLVRCPLGEGQLLLV